jgi:hypothetical protein
LHGGARLPEQADEAEAYALVFRVLLMRSAFTLFGSNTMPSGFG